MKQRFIQLENVHISCILSYISFFSDDPYYCGLRARVPNFAKEKARKSSRANEEIYVAGNRVCREPPAMKRRSIAHIDRHQPTFSSLYQLNQINDPKSSLYQRLHHHSYNIMPKSQRHSVYHARSFESGIGEMDSHLSLFHCYLLISYK